MSKNKFNILLLSSGGPATGGIIKSLKHLMNFIGCDSDPLSSNQNILDEFILIPKRTDKQYFRTITDIFNRKNIDLIYPLSSDDLAAFIENESLVPPDVFKALVKFDNDYETLFDKLKTYSFLFGKDYIPEYSTVNTKEQFLSLFYEDNEEIYSKPRVSSGGRLNFLIKKSLNINDFSGKTKSNIVDFKTFANIGDIKFEDFVFCEVLPGKELSIDVFCDKGKILNMCVRERTRVNNGVSSVSKVILSKNAEDICKDMCEKLKYDGAANIQLKEDKNNRLKLVEINPRTSGTICVSTEAGVNIVELVVRKHMGINFKGLYPKLCEPKTMIRYTKEYYK